MGSTIDKKVKRQTIEMGATMEKGGKTDKGPYFYYVRKIVGGWVQQNAYNC